MQNVLELSILSQPLWTYSHGHTFGHNKDYNFFSECIWTTIEPEKGMTLHCIVRENHGNLSPLGEYHQAENAVKIPVLQYAILNWHNGLPNVGVDIALLNPFYLGWSAAAVTTMEK